MKGIPDVKIKVQRPLLFVEDRLNILVFNCGSSSLNYKVFSGEEKHENVQKVICSGKAHRVGVKGSEPSFIQHITGDYSAKLEIQIDNHQTAGRLILAYLQEKDIHFDLIGHRFVHGGDIFQNSVLLTSKNKSDLDACLSLAPIHNPNSMSVINICLELLPAIPQYIAFDTAFHATLPWEAYTYALPKILIKEFGFRKFGFHGLSYQYVIRVAAEFINKPLDSLNMVACHLGTGGASLVAIKNGKSIETSMGYSPLSGLVMSTRSGDLDPLIPLVIMNRWGIDPNDVNQLLNKQSGILGLSGFSSDLRDIQKKLLADGDENCALAYDVYTLRLQKAIGAYMALLNGINVLIFTDDIGLQNWLLRKEICRKLAWFGISLDETKNKNAPMDKLAIISDPKSPVTVMTVPTDEEAIIAQAVFKLNQENKIASI